MAFRLTLDAGHGLGTAGKRCMKSLDPKETREWYLNDRICDRIEKLLAEYNGIEILRVDDTTGKKDISLLSRTSAANKFNANFYLSIHHNAGIKGGLGGGVVAYVYPKVDENTKAWQKELYNAVISHTGLRGNRSTPVATADFYVLRKTKMPAVLMECGFMDSATDVPKILSEDFSNKVADACVEVIVKRAKLTKKVAASDELKNENAALKAENTKLKNSITSLQTKISAAIKALQ